MNVSASADQVGRKVDESDAFGHFVRLGIVAYGLVHLLIAWLALRLAFGSGQGSASSSGALSELAKSPVGRVSLYVVAGGFLALVLWQLLDALVGHRDVDGARRLGRRAASVGKVLVYGALGVSAFKLAVGSGASGDGTDTMTSKLMSAPFGQILVGLVGVGIVVVAGGLAYQGWAEKFTDYLDVRGHSGRSGRAVVLLGKTGYLSKAVAIAVVGVLFVWAAATHDAQKSGGLDQALHKVLQQPFGPVLLIVIALGLACYGLFCFARARHFND